MSRSKHGKIDGQFVYMLYATLDSPAYRATSHGAKALYLCLKRRVSRGRDTAYISFRTAEKELKASRRKVREWFTELEHYGFILLHQPGSLGVDGKGKAPHWRLTELGTTSKTSATGLPDGQTREFMRWNGVVFDPKPFRQPATWEKQNPGDDVVTTVVTTCSPPKSQSGDDVVTIQTSGGGDDVVPISSLTTTVVSPAPTPTSSKPLSEGSFEEKSIVGPLKGETNVVHFDERIAALEAAEKRRKLR
jgi:hypothetical protein